MTSSPLGTRVALLHPHLRAHTRARAVPALEAGPASTSRSIGDTLPTWHPAAIYWAGLLSCYLVLAAVTTAVGLVVTTWIVPLDGFESLDAALSAIRGSR